VPYSDQLYGGLGAPPSAAVMAAYHPATTTPAVSGQQVVAYQLGPITAGVDSPLGQLLGFLHGGSTNFAANMAAHGATNDPAKAAGVVFGMGADTIGGIVGQVVASAGLGTGQGAAKLGAGVGSGVSAAGPGVGLGIGNLASGVGAGVGSAAMAAGPGVGAGVGGAAAGVGTGLGSALPAAGAGVGVGAGATLTGLGTGLGNLFTNAAGTGNFGMIALALAALLIIILLAR